MARKVSLGLTQLEAREVPSASLFADIRAGVWGSYPLNLTPSGGTLYFSADDGHGYELYRTDGTPGSVRMVKDIKPGVGGSDPMNVLSADNGVVYFTADDGTGRALWKTDGTTTAKVPGVPAAAQLDNTQYPNWESVIGRNGKLYFTTSVPGPSSGQQAQEWWVTDGTTTTRLAALGYSGPWTYNALSIDGNKVVLTRSDGGFSSQWTTDGTAAGTRRAQLGLSGGDPSLYPVTSVPLEMGVPVGGGKYVHSTKWNDGKSATIWVSDGQNPSSVKLIATIPSRTLTGNAALPVVKVGDKVFFSVGAYDPTSASNGLWQTDGTAAGTRRVDVLPGAPVSFNDLQAFAGKLLFRSYDWTAGRERYYLSDGTAAGTAEVPLPDAPTDGYGFTQVGHLPAMPGYPDGALVLKLGAAGKPYITNGTHGAYADPTDLPTGFNLANASYRTDPAGRAVSNSPQAGVYFNGNIYFQAANGDQRAELWKWNPFTATVPPQQNPPIVVGTTVNDPAALGVSLNVGSAQRSVVTSLTVHFDRAVNLVGPLQLTDATGKAYIFYLGDPAPDHDSVTIHFGGGSLPDGRYTLTVKAGTVTDPATGATLASDYTFQFTRLFGDLNGDGVYDRDTRTMVHNALGARVGDDPRYAAYLDVNQDGVIDATDELAAVRNWGKSV